MRILFLDDDDNRHKEFKRSAAGNLVDHARSAAEAIFHLDRTTYDQVYLDYDLASDPDELLMDDYQSGQVVAEHVAEEIDPSPGTQFIIHSLNNFGSVEMMSILRSSGHQARCVPWAWQKNPRDI